MMTVHMTAPSLDFAKETTGKDRRTEVSIIHWYSPCLECAQLWVPSPALKKTRQVHTGERRRYNEGRKRRTEQSRRKQGREGRRDRPTKTQTDKEGRKTSKGIAKKMP